MRPVALLLIMIVSSCAITREKMVGEYSFEPAFEVGAYLHLNSDGTFRYDNGTIRPRSNGAEGTWLLENKDIVLNSYTDGRNSAVTFDRTEQAGFTINVSFEDVPTPCAAVKIFYGLQIKEINTDLKGQVQIALPGIDSISVRSVGSYDVRFSVPLNSNCFDVKLNYYDPIQLVNEHWMIRGKKLFPSRSNNNINFHYLKRQRSGGL